VKHPICFIFFCAAILLFSSGQSAAQQINPGTDSGLPPFGSFHGSEFDQVNLLNGNLHIEIPIWSIKQRGGGTLVWKYVFDSPEFVNQWYPEPEMTNPAYGIHQVGGGLGPNSGWRMVGPFNSWTVENIEVSAVCASTNQTYEYTQSWVLIDSQGTRHPLDLRTEPDGTCMGQTLTGPTLDGTGAIVNAQSGAITLKNGTQLNVTGLQPNESGTLDTNGNYIINSSPGTDNLGRNPVTVTNGSGYTLYTFTDSSDTSQTFRVDFGNVTISTDMCTYPLLPKNDPCYEISPPSSLQMAQKLTLPNGKVIQFAYNSNGMGEMTQITLPTGASISYTYKDSFASQPIVGKQWSFSVYGRRGVVSRTVTMGSTSSTWNYTLSWLGSGTSSVVDPYGNKEVRTISNITVPNTSAMTTSPVETEVQYYDPKGNLLRTVNKSYAAEQDPYNISGAINVRLTSETTTLNNNFVSQKQTDYETFAFACNASTYCPGTATRLNPTEIREYDYGSGSPGALLRRTDYTYLHANNSTYTNLNIVDRPLSMIIYDGSSNTLAQTQMEYDNYTQGIQASGAIQHDSAFSTTYTTRGNLTASKKWRNTDGTWLTTRNQFDDAGNIVSTTDPGSHTNTFSYSDSWTAQTGGTSCASSGPGMAYLTQTTDALGHTTHSTFYSCTGFLGSATDNNAQVTTVAYDLFGRTLTAQFPAVAGKATFSYDDTNLIVTTARSQSGAAFVYGRSHYDQLGRPSEDELCEDGTSSCATSVKTDHTYDLLDRKATITNPYRNSTDSTDGTSSFGYDALSRPNLTVPPDGTSSTNNVITVFSGNCATVTDQAGKIRKSCTDGLGRLTQVFEPNSSNSLVNETDYAYDALNNLLSVNQKGNDSNSGDWRTRTFTYNSLKQLLTATNPESGEVKFTYDPDGNVLTKSDARGIVTTYTYDVTHRITGKTYSSGDHAVIYTYDQTACLGQSSCFNVGHLTRMTDAAGSEAWSYDAVGRVLTVQRTNGTITKSTSYTYNLDGTVATVTYPSGRTLTYKYDSAGRQQSAIDAANGINYALDGTYAAPGALASAVFGQTSSFSGITLSQTFNNRLQPSTILASSSNGTVLNLAYTFASSTGINNGDLLSITNNLNTSRTQNFTYDELNRLQTASTQATSGTYSWGFSYTYDIWANLLSASVTQGSAPALSQTTTSNNQVSGFCYDASGNLLDQTTCPTGTNPPHTYNFDAESRLSSTAGTTYTYDGQGRRVQKSSGVLYWYGVGDTLLDQSDSSGNITDEYVFFAGKRIAHRGASGIIIYYFADHLGTSRIITTAAGTVCYDSDFYPFGGERNYTNTCPQNFKFTGKERDSESGLDDFGARYYASSLGRWLTPDWSAVPAPVPYANLTIPQTLNLYSYVTNNPVTGIDPDGHADPRQLVPFLKPPFPDANYSQELTFHLLDEASNDPGDPNAAAEVQNNGGESQAPSPGAQPASGSPTPPQAQNPTYGRQPDGSYKAPTGPGSEIAKIEDPNSPPSVSIGNGQCVTATAHFSGVTRDTSKWTQGKPALELTDADKGVAVATFDSKGHYFPTSPEKNSGIYMGTSTKGSFHLLDQWPARTDSHGNIVRPATPPVDRIVSPNGRYPSDASYAYFVIIVK